MSLGRRRRYASRPLTLVVPAPAAAPCFVTHTQMEVSQLVAGVAARQEALQSDVRALKAQLERLTRQQALMRLS